MPIRQFRVHLGALCAPLGFALLGGLSTPYAVADRVQHPIKLAVFEMELEDFSAGAASIAARPEDVAQLRLATGEIRRLLAESGRYALIDAEVAQAAGSQPLWNCDGCDAKIAARLGAEQSLVASVTRVSMTEYTMQFHIRDANTGALLGSGATDLRIGANYSWSRGADWLIKNRLLAVQGPG
jgi:hypothetical protein